MATFLETTVILTEVIYAEIYSNTTYISPEQPFCGNIERFGRIMELPKLYKKSSKNKVQLWEICTDKNTIITRWGLLEGNIQETRDTLKEGKNIGKSNETTPIQQAELEAKSLWEKKKKKGYVESESEAISGKTDSLIQGGIFPMLAHSYDKHGHKIEWPAYVQPKLDGHRCIAIIQNGKASMWTRSRKPIVGLPHIIKELESISLPNGVFDGELYTHGKHTFEELSSFIRQKKTPKPGHEVVQYWIYDYPHDYGFSHRIKILQELFTKNISSDSILKSVPTTFVKTESEAMELFDDYWNDGYEGIMIRNGQGAYKNGRSYDLLKVKRFDDAEFEVIGVEEGRGKMAGKAVFICRTEQGNEFHVKMKGKLEDMAQYIEHPDRAIGRQLTVRYQGWTDALNVPRIPIGLRFRENL